MLRRLQFLLPVLFLWGCSSNYKPLYIDNASQSLAVIRQSAMSSLPMGLMSSSPNGRELKSRYFVIEGKGKGKFVDGIQKSPRYQALITILGERRPYEVQVWVMKEERINGSYQYKVSGQDIRLANLVKGRLKEQLAKRREDMNIIDDFRVF